MEFSESILFTTTCEGKITNISYKKEASLVMKILKSIDVEIESYDVISKEEGETQMDIIKYNCDKGYLKIPNITGMLNEEYADMFKKEFYKSKKNKLIDEDILCIGCNYGEYMSKDYVKMTTPIKKSNRGRKKKSKKKSSRKRIGNGNYFNSQITVTLRDPEKTDILKEYSREDVVVDNEIYTKLKSCMYHIKIYTNGKFQVPFVRDEDINTVLPTVEKAMSIISVYEGVREIEDVDCEIEYIKSIMRNYRFNIKSPDLLIDIKKLRKLVSLYKMYIEDSSELDSYEYLNKNSMLYSKMTKTELEDLKAEFKEKAECINQRKITLVKYNNDNYTGFVIKFLTPIENKPAKETTAAIFDSNKINLYGCNDREESNILKKILYELLSLNNKCCLYDK